MLPKRPTSCLAVLVLPVGLLLLLVALGMYGLKYFYGFNDQNVNPGVSSSSASQTQVQEKPVRFPTSVPTSTRVLVATASSNAAQEEVFVVDETGTVTSVKDQTAFRPQNWKTQGLTLTPPDDQVTGSSWRVTGNGWNVPLRTPGGSNWQDPVIWGRFASGRLAIVSYRTQRALLSVSKAGDIQVVDVLDDSLAPLAVQGKNAWFVQSSSSESALEIPQGPSELVRISETGVRTTVAQDPGMILELVPSPTSTTLAYLSSDSSLVVVRGDKILSDIKGTRPLAWLNERILLVSRNRTLAWVDVDEPKRVILLSTFDQPIRAARLSTPSEQSVLK